MTEVAPDAEVDAVVRRLEQRFLSRGVSYAELERRVRAAYHSFDGVRVRSFVPVFVERDVRRSIDEPADSPARRSEAPPGPDILLEC